MKLLILLLPVALWIASCESPSQPLAFARNQKDSIKDYKQSTAVSPTKPGTENFADFWQRFRTAVLQTDTTGLMTMTTFPFQTRGMLDYDSVVEYDRPQFMKVFTIFLQQYNGLDTGGRSELNYIRRTEVPGKGDISGDEARMGNLSFSRTASGWKLDFAYLDEDTIDSLQKQ